MTLLVDAAPLVALADRADPMRSAVEAVLRAERGALVVPAPVSAEADYLLGRRIGVAARQAFVDDCADGRFVVECLEQEEYGAVADVDRRYGSLHLGLADAAIVVLARRLRTRRILTFDERHFRAIRPLQGGAFAILPADA
ncbi:MAG: PIN domain-containing protein [Actinobacteria bacterium]|nr:PIN domain-containing protein [Actinomycetota bacterium]